MFLLNTLLLLTYLLMFNVLDEQHSFQWFFVFGLILFVVTSTIYDVVTYSNTTSKKENDVILVVRLISLLLVGRAAYEFYFDFANRLNIVLLVIIAIGVLAMLSTEIYLLRHSRQRFSEAIKSYNTSHECKER